MANNCYFEGKLVGKKEEVLEVYQYFVEPYGYCSEKLYPQKPHFWRIFSSEITEEWEEIGQYNLTFFGDCAWSLCAALLSGGYYKDWLDENGNMPTWCKGVCLEDVHEKFPDLKIELFSEELGVGFSEHILIDGDEFLDECGDLCVTYYFEEDEDEAKKLGREIEVDYYDVLPEWLSPVDDSTAWIHDWSI